ncbi:MAG TPA: shikimate dehydrogenase [Gaiellales bacterium]
MIGHPVAHSRSPAMHTAAYRSLGMDWEYTAIDVAPDGLGEFVAGLAAAGFAGVNVTIPHKQAVLPLCHELSDEARGSGSVNTVLVRPGALRGETTDGDGLLWALGDVAPADALVLGAGGAARAAVSALVAAGWRVAVSARRPEAAAALGVEGRPWPPREAAALVVNATPIGQREAGTVPITIELLGPGMVVCDLAYRGDGRPTALIEAAPARGARAVDGLDVLVGQGIAAFELLTGVPAPVEVMRAAARGETAQDR